MKRKIKFGFSTLLAMVISMNFAMAQQSNQPEKPNATSASEEYQTLKKDWHSFQAKAENKALDPAQKPVLEKEYNGLVEQLESVCEGIKPAPAKASVKVATSTAPSAKPKKEQVSAMK
ncbi:MAG: hypothetical protein SFV55_12225 [Haliscomenobacter sp.]|uniref:hypothetical protein n=1 Tax=Haliscomenobacter sp. TaxID=2717303 RepID=UPI0029BA8546|nr:hypothetical protein [Haliscomenobacter sp.]MDX2069181.1 hypothetical protein [Haliscomenobacter sp.]